MAMKRVYSAELRDMFTGNQMTYRVEMIFDVRGEQVWIIDPDGNRIRAVLVQQLNDLEKSRE